MINNNLSTNFYFGEKIMTKKETLSTKKINKVTTEKTEKSKQPRKTSQNGRSTKSSYPEFTSIHEAETFANEQASKLEKKIDNKWAGILVEAIPSGYKIVLEKNKEEFFKKIKDPKYRHWA